MPTRRCIVEPFAGSAGYATLYYDREVILYDKNPIIAGVWDYLIKAKSSEILALPELLEGSARDLPICQEARWLIGLRCGYAVTSPTSIKPSGSRGRSAIHKGRMQRFQGNSWANPDVKVLIARQVEFIRHWKVVNGSYDQIDNRDATWFVDPPYQHVGGYKCSNTDIDFAHLGQWCRGRTGQVMVCENDEADWLPFLPFREVNTKELKTYHEVIWTKY
jgi:site-specific DNA-adenine methylase